MTEFSLDIDALHAALARSGVPAGRFTIDLRSTCASTNSTLLELAEGGAGSGTVLLALDQQAGRGRRGRQWLSRPGDTLTFSLLWRFAPGTLPSGLSLAVGVALARALDPHLHQVCAGGTASVPRLALKWPNDILLDGRKLAGVLVELVPGAAHAAVIGIGLNRHLSPTLPDDIRAQAAAWPLATPATTLLADILAELARCLDQFGAHGFAALHSDWQRWHAHQDQPVTLLDDFAPPRHGICRGADRDGALLFDEGQGSERVLSGDISLRAGRP